MQACGNPKCGTSTGICESITHGSGKLSHHGYWQNPCYICARASEQRPGNLWGRHWPFNENDKGPEMIKIKCAICNKDYDEFKGEEPFMLKYQVCNDCLDKDLDSAMDHHYKMAELNSHV